MPLVKNNFFENLCRVKRFKNVELNIRESTRTKNFIIDIKKWNRDRITGGKYNYRTCNCKWN